MTSPPPSPQPKAVDVEVLPPEGSSRDRLRQALSGGTGTLPRLIALLMDGLFAVPGTKLRIGLNPLLDLLPVVGDGAAAVVSFIPVLIASRSGTPRVVLARMGFNILINSLMGVIPVAGEAFAFWYRPNQRNYELLKKHLPAPGESRTRVATRGDWLFVTALLGGLGLLLVLSIVAAALVSYTLLRGLLPKP